MKHTPGPWIIEENDSQPFACHAMNGGTQYGTVFASRVMIEGGGIVALVQFTDTDAEAEDLANARVICAAPDLLAACKEYARVNVGLALECVDDSSDFANGVRHALRSVDVAKMLAAIRKAEGGAG